MPWIVILPSLHALRGIRVHSYANCRYNALYAFKWIDAAGGSRFVRYSWVPDEGERRMSLLQARKQTTDYLQRDLYDRVRRSPVRPIRFTPYAESEGDRVNRPRITRRDAALKPFDPMRLTEGIEPPSREDSEEGSCCDPALAFRPPVYDLSYRERTGAGPADR